MEKFSVVTILLLLFNLKCGEFMFVKQRWFDEIDTFQKNYGVSVLDVNNDGQPDFVVAGYTGSNFVFTYDRRTGTVANIAQENTPYAALRDPLGNAIGVTACDIDGDGREEIYFLNTNQAYAGRAAYGDKLFKWRDGRYVDLYSDPINRDLPAKSFAGRSVACVDRNGDGKYAVAVATYSYRGQGKFALVEMDDSHPRNDVVSGNIVLRDVAREAGIDRSTGGRGVVVGPILGNNGRSDIFFGNEGNSRFSNAGANFLFMNIGNGTFEDIAMSAGVQDGNENVRGLALADFNRDGLIDITYGNWDGPHRLYLQKRTNGKITFQNVASRSASFQNPSHIRTVIAADFDNDGHLEVFFNNIHHSGHLQPNKLFRVTPNGDSVDFRDLDVADALEPEGYGTGGAVTDFDGDGQLELLLSHGEGMAGNLTIFKVSTGRRHNWLRIQPKTKYGAPARGAAVKVTTKSGTSYVHIIDSGSGYLCEMEPYAHIGLGFDLPTKLSVQWPDGRTTQRRLGGRDVNKVHFVEYPISGSNEEGSSDCPIGTCDKSVIQTIVENLQNTALSSSPSLLSSPISVVLTFLLVITVFTA